MVHIILYAIVPIIVVMLAGYISGKKGIFNGENAKAFNKVVLDYALPAALFVSIVDASREMLVQDIKLSLISLIVMMFCFMLVYYVYKWCFKKNTGADAAIMALISGSSTIGFLGFAVLEPIFGTTPYVALVVAIVGSWSMRSVFLSDCRCSTPRLRRPTPLPQGRNVLRPGHQCFTRSPSLWPGLLSSL